MSLDAAGDVASNKKWLNMIFVDIALPHVLLFFETIKVVEGQTEKYDDE